MVNKPPVLLSACITSIVRRAARYEAGRFLGAEFFTDDEIESFWNRVLLPDDPNDPDACFIWIGAWDKDGYGVVWSWRPDLRRRMQFRATAIALALDDRPLPEGKMALHSCHNPMCVRPSHLREGTALMNAADRRVRIQRDKEVAAQQRKGSGA